MSSLQNKFALSKNMRNFLKIFDDVFEIINVRRLDSALNARNLKKMFKNATMKSNAQRFKFSKNIKSFRKMLENAFLRLNIYINAFIWQKSFKKLLMQDNRKILLWTNLVFQLTNIQIIVLKKKSKTCFKKRTTNQRDSWNILSKNFKIKIRSCNNLSQMTLNMLTIVANV